MTTISKIIPDVSVVMSVYNNAHTLAAAMDSVLSQEGVELEFIVIDDGSTDGSAAVLDDYARRDPRVMVIHRENQGLTASLIHGCALARGPWIARQDADDVSLPGRLKLQLAIAKQPPNPVLVGCHARSRTAEGAMMAEVRAVEDAEAARRKIIDQARSISPHGTIMFRRDVYERIGGYRLAFYFAQDLDLNIRLTEQGPVAVVPQFLYEYQFAPSAISGMRQQEQNAFRELILASQDARKRGQSDDEILARAHELSLTARLSLSNVRSYFSSWYFMGSCLLRSNPRKAREYFSEALKCCPWSLRARVRWLQSTLRSFR